MFEYSYNLRSLDFFKKTMSNSYIKYDRDKESEFLKVVRDLQLTQDERINFRQAETVTLE